MLAPVVMLRLDGLSPIDGTSRMAVLGALRLIPGEFRSEETSEACERTAGLDGQTQGR